MTITIEPFDIVSEYSRKTRTCVVVETSTGKKQPFYRSTGTNGHSKEGQWIPFEGIRAGWFVKTFDYKVPPKGHELEAISLWLAEQQIEPKFNIESSREQEINKALGVDPWT